MDEKLLIKLLHMRSEKDWFDFKRKLEIYQSDGNLVEIQRDELIKDILGLANGNSHVIRKTKYLIVGADNLAFDEKGMRVLHHVDYKTPEQKDLVEWLRKAAQPFIVGFESELVLFQGVNLWIITIPPTFDIHETTRELNAKGHFQKNVVFMRRDEHTEPATAREAATILQLKQLHRQEIENPSSIWIGAITGGIVSAIIGTAKINASEIILETPTWFFQSFFGILGMFFGLAIGFVAREIRATTYDWRYWQWWKRLTIIAILTLAIIIANILTN